MFATPFTITTSHWFAAEAVGLKSAELPFPGTFWRFGPVLVTGVSTGFWTKEMRWCGPPGREIGVGRLAVAVDLFGVESDEEDPWPDID